MNKPLTHLAPHTLISSPNLLKGLIFLLLISLTTSCSVLKDFLPKPPSAEPKTTLIKSNTENYGIRFPSSTPMLNRINLVPNRFNHHITHNTPRDGSYTMMHWREHDKPSNTTITDIIKATNYNKNSYYNNNENFGNAKWYGVEKLADKTKIISEKTQLIKDVKVQFIVSQEVYLVKKSSFVMKPGQEAKRIFLHAFIEQPNYLLEIFQPSGYVFDFAAISTEKANDRITEFIEEYLEVNLNQITTQKKRKRETKVDSSTKSTSSKGATSRGNGFIGLGTGAAISVGKNLTNFSSAFGTHSPVYLDLRWNLPKAGALQFKAGGLTYGEKNGRSVNIGGFYGLYLRPLIDIKPKIRLYAAAGISATALGFTNTSDRRLKAGATAGLSLTIEAIHFLGQTGFIDISPRLSYQHRVLTLEAPIGLLFLF